MKLLKESIIYLSKMGYITLQVPSYVITDDDNIPKDQIKEFPDEWFMFADNAKGPALGKESGFMFLTEKGWKENKDNIKKAFEQSPNPRGTWEDFEEHSKKHFKQMKILLDKRIKYFQKKLKQAEFAKIKLENGE